MIEFYGILSVDPALITPPNAGSARYNYCTIMPYSRCTSLQFITLKRKHSVN